MANKAKSSTQKQDSVPQQQPPVEEVKPTISKKTRVSKKTTEKKTTTPPKSKGRPSLSESKKSTRNVKKTVSGGEQIAKPALHRILYRAGVKRVSSLTYQTLRDDILKRKLKEIMKATLLSTEYEKRQTVMEHDVRMALEQAGWRIAVGLNKEAKKTKNLEKCDATPKKKKVTKPTEEGEKKKKVKFRAGTVALRKIRYYQKESDCLLIPKLNFQRLVKHISREYWNEKENKKLRFKKGVIDIIQVVMEEYLTKIARNSYLLSLHSNRVTLLSIDLKLMQRLEQEMQ
jgi:histone H3